MSGTIKKGNRLIGCIKSIIDSHDDFNRVYYGDVLWKSIALPTINYACAVSSYSASDYKNLDKLQIQMARAILKAPRNTPAAALLGDLGWSNFKSIHDKAKVKFFSRLKNMDLNRWPKLLLNALSIIDNNNNTNNNVRNLSWKWFESINNTLRDNDMSFMFRVHSENNEAWLNVFNNIHDRKAKRNWYDSACQKSSLSNYVGFKMSPQLEQYLLDKLDFYGASLKFKARSNTLPLDRKLSTWDKTITGICSLCNEGIEDVPHFMLTCKVLDCIRNAELAHLKDNLCNVGYEFIWNMFISNETSVQFNCILGNNAFIQINFLSQESCVGIDSIFDLYCKAFLKRAWSFRSDLKCGSAHVT